MAGQVWGRAGGPQAFIRTAFPRGGVWAGRGRRAGRPVTQAGPRPCLPAGRGPGAPSVLGHPPRSLASYIGGRSIIAAEPKVTNGSAAGSDPQDGISGCTGWLPPRPLSYRSCPGASAWGRPRGGAQGGGCLSQRPRSRKTGWSHLPVVGVPSQLPQQPGLLHPLTVTSEGIYGAINLRQACLVQLVTTQRAGTFPSPFPRFSTAVDGWGKSSSAHSGAPAWAGSPHPSHRPVN